MSKPTLRECLYEEIKSSLPVGKEVCLPKKRVKTVVSTPSYVDENKEGNNLNFVDEPYGINESFFRKGTINYDMSTKELFLAAHGTLTESLVRSLHEQNIRLARSGSSIVVCMSDFTYAPAFFKYEGVIWNLTEDLKDDLRVSDLWMALYIDRSGGYGINLRRPNGERFMHYHSPKFNECLKNDTMNQRKLQIPDLDKQIPLMKKIKIRYERRLRRINGDSIARRDPSFSEYSSSYLRGFASEGGLEKSTKLAAWGHHTSNAES